MAETNGEDQPKPEIQPSKPEVKKTFRQMVTEKINGMFQRRKPATVSTPSSAEKVAVPTLESTVIAPDSGYQQLINGIDTETEYTSPSGGTFAGKDIQEMMQSLYPDIANSKTTNQQQLAQIVAGDLATLDQALSYLKLDLEKKLPDKGKALTPEGQKISQINTLRGFFKDQVDQAKKEAMQKGLKTTDQEKDKLELVERMLAQVGNSSQLDPDQEKGKAAS